MAQQPDTKEDETKNNNDEAKEVEKTHKKFVKPRCKVRQWFMDKVSFTTKYNVTLTYSAPTKQIFFVNNKKEPYKDLDSVLYYLTPYKEEIVYLEWCDIETGKYYYFNVLKLMSPNEYNKDRKHYIDTTEIISSDWYEFDESQSLHGILEKKDILILSPIRSMIDEYTLIGKYNNHSLYLGPFPSDSFIYDLNVNILFNCSNKNNDEDTTMKIENVKEIMFQVTEWRWKHFENNNDSKKNKNSFKNRWGKNKNKKKNKKDKHYDKYCELDEQIDVIYNELKENNVLIHCLAGAHRSPFITGCFLAKYCPNDFIKHTGKNGNSNGKNGKNGNIKDKGKEKGKGKGKEDENKNAAEDLEEEGIVSTKLIYQFLREKRAVVEPLSYDEELDQYIKFLQKENHRKSI